MLVAKTVPAPNLAEAYAYCRGIALGHYENFPMVSWLLPRELRDPMYAVYAYCRGVDDLGDEADGDRLTLLDEWAAELRSAYDGTPSDPRFVALADTIRRFDLPPEPFERLIEANRRDQRQIRYDTFEELLDYCTYSANPVGRLVLNIFGYRDERRFALSDATCTALQLANIWQDVARDYAMGRIYIPGEDMAMFGVTEADIASGKATTAFRKLLRYEVERTREYFRRGLPLIDSVRGRLRMDLRLFSLGGLVVLDAIKGQRFDVLSQRPTVSLSQKIWLGARALVPVRIWA